MNTPKADRESTCPTKLSGSEIGKNFLKKGSIHGLKHSFYAKGKLLEENFVVKLINHAFTLIKTYQLE